MGIQILKGSHMKRSLLLVDDDELVLKALERSLRRFKSQWNILNARSHQDALNLFPPESIDLLITEIRLKNSNARNFLDAFKTKHPKATRIILTGYTDPNEVYKYAGLAHQLMAKPWEDEILFDTIGRADLINHLFGDERFKSKLNAIENIPSIPKVYTELVEKLKDDDTSTRDVGNIIIKDPALAVRLLQIVNSPFYGLPMPVADPVRAVSLLGLNMIKGIVLTSEIFEQYQNRSIKSVSIDQIWQHSLQTANIVRQISKMEHLQTDITEECFTACLLHDIGKIVIATDFKEEHNAIRTIMSSQNVPIWQAELQILGITHAEIGAYLIGLWGLPLSVIQCVFDHHQPDFKAHTQIDHTALLHVANALERDAATSSHHSDLNDSFIAHLKIDKNIASWKEQISLMA